MGGSGPVAVCRDDQDVAVVVPVAAAPLDSDYLGRAAAEQPEVEDRERAAPRFGFRLCQLAAIVAPRPPAELNPLQPVRSSGTETLLVRTVACPVTEHRHAVCS